MNIITGIYLIQNKINGKNYVGSSININCRWNKHKSLLRRGLHKNENLQIEWNKYGEDCFKFEVVEKIPDGQSLQEAEDVWLKAHHGEQYCYNTGRRSDAPWRGGPKELHTAYGHAELSQRGIGPDSIGVDIRRSRCNCRVVGVQRRHCGSQRRVVGV